MPNPDITVSTLAALRVIVIEDEPLLAMCLIETIEDAGCVVVGSAGSLPDALALVAAATFDVAVLDLNLHGLPVAPVASAIVGSGRAIVFSSGSSAANVPAEFQNWPVLLKPYRDEALFKALAIAKVARSGASDRTELLLQKSLTV